MAKRKKVCGFLDATIASARIGGDVWVQFHGKDNNPVWLDSWPPFQDPPDGHITDDEYAEFLRMRTTSVELARQLNPADTNHPSWKHDGA